jgi:hypothetical protein
MVNTKVFKPAGCDVGWMVVIFERGFRDQSVEALIQGLRGACRRVGITGIAESAPLVENMSP